MRTEADWIFVFKSVAFLKYSSPKSQRFMHIRELVQFSMDIFLLLYFCHPCISQPPHRQTIFRNVFLGSKYIFRGGSSVVERWHFMRDGSIFALKCRRVEGGSLETNRREMKNIFEIRLTKYLTNKD